MGKLDVLFSYHTCGVSLVLGFIRSVKLWKYVTKKAHIQEILLASNYYGVCFFFGKNSASEVLLAYIQLRWCPFLVSCGQRITIVFIQHHSSQSLFVFCVQKSFKNTISPRLSTFASLHFMHLACWLSHKYIIFAIFSSNEFSWRWWNYFFMMKIDCI